MVVLHRVLWNSIFLFRTLGLLLWIFTLNSAVSAKIINIPIDTTNRAFDSEQFDFQNLTHNSLDSSLAEYNEALEYYGNQKNELKQAEVIEAIAETYRYYDIPDKAIENFLKSAKLYEHEGLHISIIRIYNSMTDLFMRQSDIESANSYSKLAYQLLLQSENNSQWAAWHNNTGRILNNYKHFDSAIYHYEKAIGLYDASQQYHAKGRAMHNMANSLRELKKYDKALQVCKEVLMIPKIQENAKSEIFTTLLIADIYNNMGEPNKSIPYGMSGLELSESHGLMDRKRVACLYLSQSYELLGDFRNAYLYHKRYALLMDSVFDNTRYEQVSRMRATYETEKQIQTIKLQEANLKAQEAAISLKDTQANQLILVIGFATILALGISFGYIQKSRKNNLLLRQKNEIERQNYEREILLKEIHHRVKNNLQVISSLLSMQSRKMSDSDAKMAVREGQCRIKSMSLIHQRLYSQNNLSKINMKEYIEELSDFLFKSYKPVSEIEKIIQSDELMLDVDQAIPLGLIINELISNALKYAFLGEQKGQLLISFSRSDNDIILKVADSGKGLPENYDIGESMGLNLVDILVKQLDGELLIEQSIGASFKIIFKEKTAA